MKRLLVMAALLATAACTAQKGGTITTPVFDSTVDGGGGRYRALSVPSPVWTGTTTASDGVGGTVVLTFGDPSTVVWTGPTGTYHGTVGGELPSLTIMGSDNSCHYTAAGVVANGVFSGNYDITGDACLDKTGHGTFTVTQGAPTPDPEPTVCGSTTYWQMLQGNETHKKDDEHGNPKKNACENRGGEWLGDWNDHHDVCKFTPNPPGNPGNDMLLLQTDPVFCPAGPSSR